MALKVIRLPRLLQGMCQPAETPGISDLARPTVIGGDTICQTRTLAFAEAAILVIMTPIADMRA